MDKTQQVTETTPMLSPDKASWPDTDVAKEHYKGPNKAVIAVGRGSIEHLLFATIGLVSAASLALIFPTTSRRIIAHCRDSATEFKKSSSFIKRGLGRFTHGIIGEGKNAVSAHLNTPQHSEWLSEAIMNKEQGFGNALISHVPGNIPLIGRPIKRGLLKADDRWSNAIAFGGAFGAAGYLGGWIKALMYGTNGRNEGKRQFENTQARLQASIGINELLEEKLSATQQELNNLKTVKAAEDGTLHVAKDETPEVDTTTPIIAAEQADSGTGTIDAPRIKEPPLQTPVIQGPAITPAPRLSPGQTGSGWEKALADSGTGTIEPDPVVEPPLQTPVTQGEPIAPQPRLSPGQPSTPRDAVAPKKGDRDWAPAMAERKAEAAQHEAARA